MPSNTHPSGSFSADPSPYMDFDREFSFAKEQNSDYINFGGDEG